MSDGGKGVSPSQIQVRQVDHYQFSWTAAGPGEPGTYTCQLVMDQGAAEHVLTLDDDDADVLFKMLSASSKVYFDTARQVLMFGTTPVG